MLGPHVLPHQILREQQQGSPRSSGFRGRRNRSADPSPIRSSSSVGLESPGDLRRPSSSASSSLLIPISPSRSASSGGGASCFFYVCSGQGCSGSRCEFTASLRHWQSLIKLQQDGSASPPLNNNNSSNSRLDESRKKLVETRDLLNKKLKAKQMNQKRRPSSRSSNGAEVVVQEEDQRAIHRRKSTGTNQKRDSLSAAVAKPKIQDNIWELSSQDLLSKSHEELVLMMIHLRRQSAALNEAIEASTAELENIQSNEESYFLVEDLRNHIRDLEEQMARGRPIVSLVDNMVKLGTLYRGPEGAPLSHRLRNIPSTPLQDEEISRESSTTKQRRAEIQELLQRSLEVVRQNINDEKELSKEDREALAEEQRVLETELSRVTNELESCQKKLDECSSDHARWEHDVLFLRQKLQASASRDMSIGLGQSAETLLVENELAQVQQRATELHKTRSAIQSKVESLTKRPSSSLLRSHQWVEEVLPPPPPPEDDEEEFNNTESSESFKKFLQSSGKGSAEAKTVRMVKRDAKERNLRAAEDDDHPEAISPPPPLPRGNYEHLHDFLKNEQEHQSVSSLSRTNSATTSRLASSNSDSKYLSSSTYKMLDMLRSHGKKEDRPGSSLSAHERLFGSSRDNSMSPPVSPQALGVKSGSSGGDSSLSSSFSANSPIFKSAAAKAIIQEVGGGSSSSSRRLKKRDKKRSYTITGSSSSAVMEALNDHAARARDDLDMERVLRGSSRPNAPDVVKSTLDKKDGKMNPSSIDNLFGVPDKIVIPERYVPEADIDNLSREERQVRLKKADSIRRMLTENTSTTDEPQNEEEKKQRERLLSLNQVLAREVMEKSRLVAAAALARKKFSDEEIDEDNVSQDSLESTESSPLYQ